MILIHKNSYSKIHSALTYACVNLYSNYTKLVNLHGNLYDIALSLKPKTIIFQIEEYTQEIHSFVNDTSIPSFNVLLSIDNNKSFYDKYTEMLLGMHTNNSMKMKLIAPADLYPVLVQNGIEAKKILAYHNIYNNYVFYKDKDVVRNDKILCILSSDKNCIDYVKSYLYPNTKQPIVMVNNPNIEYDQNIGLLFDKEMNMALNTYGSVIDLSESYATEISVCQIPCYELKNNWFDQEPKVLTQEQVSIEHFIQQISEYIL